MWCVVCFVIIAILLWCSKGALYRGPYLIYSAWLVTKLTYNLDNSAKDQKKLMFQILGDYRKKINRDLKILEVGSGAAANLQYYPANSELVCLDPNPFFDRHAEKNIKSQDNVSAVETVKGFAEEIPLESDTFDIVVCTFVLCTVTDVPKALEEIQRVLKPGGLFLFVEHVAAEKNTWTRLVQTFMNPIHRVVFDGCYVQRETENVIRSSNMKDIHVERFRAKLPFYISYCIFGSCSK